MQIRARTQTHKSRSTVDNHMYNIINTLNRILNPTKQSKAYIYIYVYSYVSLGIHASSLVWWEGVPGDVQVRSYLHCLGSKGGPSRHASKSRWCKIEKIMKFLKIIEIFEIPNILKIANILWILKIFKMLELVKIMNDLKIARFFKILKISRSSRSSRS